MVPLNSPIIAFVFDSDITTLNGSLALGSLVVLAGFYYERITCLTKCLKEHVHEKDVRRAKRFILLIVLWAAIAFLGCGTILKLNYVICLCTYLLGWGFLSLLGKPLLSKVEDPEKKRVHFYSLLPKVPPK